jgi:hypothetical protein
MAFRLPTFEELDAAADKLQAAFDHSGTTDNDVVGANGNYTFTIAQLLQNDVNAKASTFFFGDGLDALKQTEYMAAHHITDNHNGTYTAAAGFDFDYSVWTGKGLCGSFSNADVDVKDAPPPVVGHLGGSLFSESFENVPASSVVSYIDGSYNGTASQTVAVVADFGVNGWTGAGHTELVFDGSLLNDAVNPATSGVLWLDTQNSPGGIDISHTFTDSTAAIAGKTAVLSFDIGKQDLTFNGQPYATDPNSTFSFKVDGQTVKSFTTEDFAFSGQMKHFDIDLGAYAHAGTEHTLELVDNGSGYTGFAVDSIAIHDWIV